jgi:hypothetical protein
VPQPHELLPLSQLISTALSLATPSRAPPVL